MVNKARLDIPDVEDMPYGTISHSVRNILILVRSEGGVTVEECVRQLGRNSITLSLVLFTFLSCLPLFSIPGFTTITGIPIVLIGMQLLTAQDYIWLPRRIRKHCLSSPKLWRAMQRSLPYLRKMERRMAPRLTVLSTSPMRNFAGLIFVITGTLLALPIPLINFPAGVSMFMLAAGLATRDGFVVLLGLILNAALLTLMTLTLTGAVALTGVNIPFL
jgi:hypothetical protein